MSKYSLYIKFLIFIIEVVDNVVTCVHCANLLSPGNQLIKLCGEINMIFRHKLKLESHNIIKHADQYLILLFTGL